MSSAQDRAGTVSREDGPRALVRHNLPVALTSFIGRAAEIGTAREMLARHRLVTLTGPGGAGKTRLAGEIAADQAERFPDGVSWVELSHVSKGESVAGATAAAVGVLVEPVGGPLHSLVVHLGDRAAFLCLDNAEHLLDDAAAVVDAVLRGCPLVTVLVTSREPLGLAGEAVLSVPPLPDDEALALFVDRARLVLPSFTLDAANEVAARSIARHLDGIPLALELAAAWLRTLTAQQVVAGLDDRFRLLVRGPRGAQRRQQTLAGSIDWSHALLDETDRVVFRRLGAFAGSFGLDPARELAAGGPVADDDVLPALARLVDKSLVVAEEHGREVRYRLLETIRAYAMARLAEAKEEAALRERHLVWCVQFAEATDGDREHDPDRWREALHLEYDNLRAALERGLVAEDAESGRRLTASLAWLWHLDRRGRDGIGYLRRAIDRAPDDRSRLQARLLTGLALVADTTTPLDVEYDAARRALELATEVGDEGMRALCLSLAGVGAFYTDFDAAWDLCDQAHHSADAGGNTFVLGGSRALQAIILHLRDRHAEAEALVDDTVRRQLQLHRGVLSTVLGYQADGALSTGHAARARELAEEALTIAEPLGDYLRVGAARSTLAVASAMTGDVDRAQAVISPVLRLLEGVDDVFVPGLGRAMGMLSMRRGDPELAVAWWQRDAGSMDRGIETWLAARALPGLGAALAALGRRAEAATALEKAVTVAARLQMSGSLAEAFDVQADLAVSEPDGLARAIELNHAALALRVKHGLRSSQPDSLEALARHGAATKPSPDDVRALFAAESARTELGFPRAPHQQSAYDAALAQLRAALGGTVFDKAAAEGARLTLDDAVGQARRMRGRRGRPPTGWSSLTPAELQVARLVAEGLTNPEIGARLFISRGTVKTHLSHIFAKLGTPNRTELALAAAEQGVHGRRR